MNGPLEWDTLGFIHTERGDPPPISKELCYSPQELLVTIVRIQDVKLVRLSPAPLDQL